MKFIEAWKATNTYVINKDDKGNIRTQCNMRVVEDGVLGKHITLNKGEIVQVLALNFYINSVICLINHKFQVAIPFNEFEDVVQIENNKNAVVHSMCFVHTTHNIISKDRLLFIGSIILLLSSVLFGIFH